MAAMRSFDLLGELPVPGTTTVLEASAGTGKTYALAGLVTRYIAEGRATLDEMLLITFGRAASQELRDRVRRQLVEALDAIEAVEAGMPVDQLAETAALLHSLVSCADDELVERRDRLRDALAGFDTATIATTHQFCQLVLTSLGVAGDSDTGLTLVESLDELVREVVADFYLRDFGNTESPPELSFGEALSLAREVVNNPRALITPTDPEPGSEAAVRVGFARDVLAELEKRKRQRGILGFDDLLGRLAASLAEGGPDDDVPARDRMRRRWSIVMVDEFQDTDPTQWEVIERAFVGCDTCTVVLIGDPKQAIYAFRGGDIITYLNAREQADAELTLDTNWRSDEALVDRLQVVMRHARLGHSDIEVREVSTHHAGHRLSGAGDRAAPFRLRVVKRDEFGVSARRTIKMDDLRPWIADDLARDIKQLLATGPMFGDRRLRAGDIAVIVEAHKDARACRDALAAAGVPAVYTGDADVFASPAAEEWMRLLEAFEQPHRSGLVRAAAVTSFFGHTAAELGADADELTDAVARVVRQWADHAREFGMAAVLESAHAMGLSQRVLAWRGGERHLTDLEHIGALLHETAHRERLTGPGLLEWLREQTRERAGSSERNRRLDSDAAAVQIMTVWVSKGLQYPIVYLPFAFNRYVPDRSAILYHDEHDRRCLDIGGSRVRGHADVAARGRAEMAGDDIRLTYVALTRAQSQVVAWWAPSWDEPNGGLSRMLRGRKLDEPSVPDRVDRPADEGETWAWLQAWERHGGPSLEIATHITPDEPAPEAPPTDLAVREFRRPIDSRWKRTSYSGLIRDVDEGPGVRSEAETGQLDDEVEIDDGLDGTRPSESGDLAQPSPMTDLPGGAGFGSLVHGVLELADPAADDLAAEVQRHVRDQLVFWPTDVSAEELTEALLPVLDSPLGPLAPGLRLRDVGLGDRLCELDFEIPMAGGDRVVPDDDVDRGPTLSDLGRVLADHLPDDDPMAAYVSRLTDSGLATKPLLGYLSGSIDVVLRVPHPAREGEQRFVVVDYKTNRLADRETPVTAGDYTHDLLTTAMLHSDYPLQALLYNVVLHRYLRWRLPAYDPEVHLGGILYLFVRGMIGATTPVVDGHPTGAFSWHPPASLVVALSELIDGAEVSR